MHIDGNLKGSSVGYKKLEIDFSKGEKSDLSVIDSLNFQPAKVDEDEKINTKQMGPIKYNTEETTAISKISYEIENAKLYGIKSKTIGRQIDRLKEAKKIPSNLEYVDSYTDSLNGVTTSAF